jgi:hypothetical protein
VNPHLSRRECLRLVPTTSRGSLLGAGPRAREGGRGATGFDPTRHAFGFRNWSSAVPTFPQHRHQSVDESEVRRIVDARWARAVQRTLGVNLGRASEELIRSIARQVYVSASQEPTSNGHCYGMVCAAQRYFEEPAAVPLDRETASEFEHPEVPLGRTGREKSPVATDVDGYRNLQLFNPNAWIGRRGLCFPKWIDLDGSIRNVERVLDAFGTAGVTLLNSRTKASHQVVIYDANRIGGRTRLAIYDPNYSADHYRRSGTRHVEVVHSANDARMVPYESYGPSYSTAVTDSSRRPAAGPTPSTRSPRSTRRPGPSPRDGSVGSRPTRVPPADRAQDSSRWFRLPTISKPERRPDPVGIR